MPTANIVVMLLKELRTILLQLAWTYMLVVIIIEVLFGGLGYAHFRLIFARMGMASVPKLNYRLLPSFCLCKNKDGKNLVQGIE